MYSRKAVFRSLFNFKDDRSRGRSILLADSVLASVATAITGGAFHTAFLAENGIDIVRVGILTFIPYFCWIFSLFTPLIFQKIKKRRWVLLLNQSFFFACTVLATTIMPRFVEGTAARTRWFAFFIILGNITNALFGSGFEAWNLNFIPEEGKGRHYYFSIQLLVGNVVGTIVTIGASLLADALNGSPHQATVIVALRYIGFALFFATTLLIYLGCREYPYLITENRLRLRDVFLTPMQNRVFLITAGVSFLWNFACFFNSNTWTYYILNTVKVNYLLTYIPTISCALGGLFLTHFWRELIGRFGWEQVLLANVLLTALAESLMGFARPGHLVLFVAGSVLWGLNLIGAQITINNVFYVHLPKTDTDTYITFFTLLTNIFIFLGSMSGTWLLSALEGPDGAPRTVLGLTAYGSQLLICVKVLLFLALALYVWYFRLILAHSPEK